MNQCSVMNGKGNGFCVRVHLTKREINSMVNKGKISKIGNVGSEKQVKHNQ
jgi:hypothetical protein